VVERAYHAVQQPPHQSARDARPERSKRRTPPSGGENHAPNATDFAQPSLDSVAQLAGDVVAWETTREATERDREEDLSA